ncbi:DUF5408 family protein [Helicobacter brantae]|uniref:DUF5408 family protein n=1 Tax=Helicobacter brantae TaxID=375927 RepID=UPI0014756DB5|nr:DUF5408 family protein [Helicobacter brantae]
MEDIAKRALKISIFCVFLTLVIGMFCLYVLLSEVDATAGLSKRVEQIEKKLERF